MYHLHAVKLKLRTCLHSRGTGCKRDHRPHLVLRHQTEKHWHLLQRIVSKTTHGSACVFRLGENLPTFDPSQTAFECSAYCSTIGKILEVTIRCARLKLWSISWSVNVMLCSNFSSSSVRDKGRAADVLD